MKAIKLDETTPNHITLPDGWRQVNRLVPLLQIAPHDYIGQDTWHIAAFASERSVEEWAEELLGEPVEDSETTKRGDVILLCVTTVRAYATDDHYFVSNKRTLLYGHARSFTPQNRHAAHDEFAALVKNAEFTTR